MSATQRSLPIQCFFSKKGNMKGPRNANVATNVEIELLLDSCDESVSKEDMVSAYWFPLFFESFSCYDTMS